MEDARALATTFRVAMSSTSVRSLLYMFFLLAAPLIMLPQISAQYQKGFISIDCGSTSNYTDTRDSTGLNWSTDDGYISTGTNREVYAAGQKERLQQLSNARYFPQKRKKHCYILPVVPNNGYLIRSSFLYGDLDVLQAYYNFNISIDSTIVGSVTIWNVSETLTLEHVVISANSAQQIAFCLIPVVGIPFISSLELRPLYQNMYGGLFFQEPIYMQLAFRVNCGAGPTSPTVRYPDDLFDRFWNSPWTIWDTVNLSTISTTTEFTSDQSDYTPEKVMLSAWKADASIEFGWILQHTERYFRIFYFHEIEKLDSTDARVLDLSINNVTVFHKFSVPSSTGWIWSNHTEIDTGNIHFSLQRNPSSSLPPILNAAELFTVSKKATTTTDPADVSSLDDVRHHLNLLDWAGDPCLPVSWDWLDCSSDEFPTVTRMKLSGYQLSGTIPSSIANLTNLTDLWLDNNFLVGPIPNLGSLIHLKTLHLQNNVLNGSIPSSLADIPDLSELFLTNNTLTGPVPPALLHKDGLNLQVDNLTTGGSKGGTSGAIIGAIIGPIIAVVGIFVALCICMLCRKRRKTKLQMKRYESKVESNGGVQITKAFSDTEVQRATDNFRHKIGEGGFGSVYYGKLDTGEEIAVKLNSSNSAQGPSEFSTEVSLLSRVHHRNLVSLVGFCDEGDARILIYEFMQNGTLREHLYGSGKTMVMDWKTRLDVALNAARGLEYLHYDCNPRIIHRDVKSSNILLNEKMLAKVADFGISKSTPDEEKTNTKPDFNSVVRGTFGYIDPEYFTTNKLTYKSDVYSFGVVLLELISGRPPIDERLNQMGHPTNSLIDYGRQMLRDWKLDAIVDPSLKGNYNLDAMGKLAELAIDCVEPASMDRPDMRRVVQKLSEAVRFEDEQNSLPATSRRMASGFLPSDSTPHLSYPSPLLSELSLLTSSTDETSGITRQAR